MQGSQVKKWFIDIFIVNTWTDSKLKQILQNSPGWTAHKCWLFLCVKWSITDLICIPTYLQLSPEPSVRHEHCFHSVAGDNRMFAEVVLLEMDKCHMYHKQLDEVNSCSVSSFKNDACLQMLVSSLSTRKDKKKKNFHLFMIWDLVETDFFLYVHNRQGAAYTCHSNYNIQDKGHKVHFIYF